MYALPVEDVFDFLIPRHLPIRSTKRIEPSIFVNPKVAAGIFQIAILVGGGKSYFLPVSGQSYFCAYHFFRIKSRRTYEYSAAPFTLIKPIKTLSGRQESNLHQSGYEPGNLPLIYAPILKGRRVCECTKGTRRQDHNPKNYDNKSLSKKPGLFCPGLCMKKTYFQKRQGHFSPC